VLRFLRPGWLDPGSAAQLGASPRKKEAAWGVQHANQHATVLLGTLATRKMKEWCHERPITSIMRRVAYQHRERNEKLGAEDNYDTRRNRDDVDQDHTVRYIDGEN
jgi:hypothetical protein